MISRRIAVGIAVLVLAPAAAQAQFTTFVAPPKKVDTIVVRDSALAAAPSADVVAGATIANMKAWVDSAAGGGVNLRAMDSTQQVPTVTTDRVDAFTNGAPAPNTATPLPMLAALGMSALGIGAFLLKRK